MSNWTGNFTNQLVNVSAIATSAATEVVNLISLIRKTVSGIDAKATGATLIFTTDQAGKNFYITHILIECLTATAVLGVAIASIGTNATNYNDILALTTLTGLTTASKYIAIPVIIIAAVIPASTGVYVNVGTGATATTQTFSVSVIGYYK